MNTWSYANPVGQHFLSSESQNTVSSGFIFHLRFRDAACADGMQKGTRQKKHTAPWNRIELWRGMWKPRFCRDLGAKIWVDVTDTQIAICLQWLCANEGVTLMARYPYVSMRMCSAVCGIPSEKCIYISCKMTQSLGLYYALKWGLSWTWQEPLETN